MPGVQQQAVSLLDHGRVERDERLVEEEQFRLDRERSGDGDAPRESARG